MLNHIEATSLFNHALEKTKRVMRREGFIFPFIFIVNKGKKVTLDYDDEIILDQATSELEEDDSESIHVGYLTLSGSEVGYVAQAQKLMKKVTRTSDPDAIGIFIPSLYNEGEAEEMKRIKSLNADPESIRVVHGVFYVREDPQATMYILPYVNHGELPPDKQIPGECLHNVVFADFGWTRPLEKIGPGVENPYERSTA